ncbi:MAG: hypothetical protein QXT25_02780 [Candidatus Anstonellaceae archaeon]
MAEMQNKQNNQTFSKKISNVLQIFKRKEVLKEDTINAEKARAIADSISLSVKILKDADVPYFPLLFILPEFSKEDKRFLEAYNMKISATTGFVDMSKSQYFLPLLITSWEAEVIESNIKAYLAIHIASKNPFQDQSNDEGGVILAFRQRVTPFLPKMVPLSPFYFITEKVYVPVQEVEALAARLVKLEPALSPSYVLESAGIFVSSFIEYKKELQARNIDLKNLTEKTKEFNSIDILSRYLLV